MFDLSGKTVVVTGGGKGLGKAMALAVAESGASVVIAGRELAPLAAVAAEIRAIGRNASFLSADITKPGDVDAIVATAIREHGYLDCWINNAGSAEASDVGPLLSLSEAQWDTVVDSNLKWAFFGCQAAARVMTRGGSIIVISSRSASFPTPNMGQYAAAKAGMESLTRTMAAEWGHLNIRVNAIAPGVVLTQGGNHGVMAAQSRQQRQINQVPLQRLGRPEDVAPLCVYFASDESQWVSGTVVPINGGSPISSSYLSYLYHIGQSRSGAQIDGAT